MDSTLSSEECLDGYCEALIHSNYSILIGSSSCENKTSVPEAALRFILTFDINSYDQSVNYEFDCNYDNCNNESIWREAISIFHQKYNILSILKVFGYEEEETTVAPTKSSTSQRPTSVNATNSTSVTTEKSNYALNLQATNGIISFALFIITVYFNLCI